MKNIAIAIVLIVVVNDFQTISAKKKDLQGIAPRGRLCRGYGGRCILRRKPCELPDFSGVFNDTLKGRPWCYKRRKCCFPDHCLSLKPIPGFWIPDVPSDSPSCSDFNGVQTDIFEPGRQCCLPITCPDEFKLIEGQCFKMFNSSTNLVSYHKAWVYCDKYHSHIGEPQTKTTMIKLAEYAASIDSSEAGHYWLGARGDGSGLMWETGGPIPADTPWMNDQPEGVSNAWCLDLRADSDPITIPMATWECDKNHWFICEAEPLIG